MRGTLPGMKIDGFSIETTPGGARMVGSFAALLPQGTRVFVTHLPDGALVDVVRTAGRLAGAGMSPVPHIGARHLESRAVLDGHLDALRSVGVREVLLIGGDRSEPLGLFSEAGDLIGPAAERFERLYFAGHPEEDRDAALLAKIASAHAAGAEAAIVTQFVFEAEAVLTWEERIARLGNMAPIRVGLPGVASPGALLRYARGLRRRALAARTVARRPVAKNGRALDSGNADFRPPGRAFVRGRAAFLPVRGICGNGGLLG